MLQAWWLGTHTLIWQQRRGESPPPSSEPTWVWPQGCERGLQPGSAREPRHSLGDQDSAPGAEQGGHP